MKVKMLSSGQIITCSQEEGSRLICSGKAALVEFDKPGDGPRATIDAIPEPPPPSRIVLPEGVNMKGDDHDDRSTVHAGDSSGSVSELAANTGDDA